MPKREAGCSRGPHRTRNPTPIVLITVAMTTAAACSDGSSNRLDESSRLSLTDTMWIGAVDGDGPDVFGSIGALAVDVAGRIHVFDGQAHELRIFGANGSFISAFGRRGGGPGEFQHVIGISTAPDGAVWVVDGANARYTVIRDGEMATYPRGAGVYRVPWLGGHVAGYLTDAVLVPSQDSREVLVRVDGAGVVADTFPIAANEIETPRAGSIQLPLPYAARQIRTLDNRGAIWLATSHQYALYRVALSGDTLSVIRRDLEPRPLTSAEADSVARYIRTLRAEFRVDVRDGLIPRTAPLLRGLTVAENGSVWVTRAEPPDGWEVGTLLDVFSPDGRLVSEIKLPFPLSLEAVRDGRIYGVARDELGVQRVFSARVERDG